MTGINNNKKSITNVFINYQKHSIYQKNTDINYSLKFQELAANSRFNIVFNESRISSFLTDIASYLKRTQRFKPIFKLKFFSRMFFYFSRNSFIFPWQIQNVDIIISHWFFPKVLWFKSPPIILCSGFPPNSYSGVVSDEQRRSHIPPLLNWFNQSDAVVFPTKSWIEHFNSLDSRFKEKIIYLPKIIPEIRYLSPEEIEQKFNNYNEIRILFVGRDGKRKGLFELLEAIKRIIKDYPELTDRVKLTLITESNIYPIEGIKIEHYRKLEHKKVLEIMHKSHIFCLPTHRDSYGLVFIEAMASGCAIIADNQNPRTEILDDGYCGFLVEPKNIPNIVQALKELSFKPELAKEKAIRARDKFANEFCLEKVKFGYMDLIDQLLDRAKYDEKDIT